MIHSGEEFYGHMTDDMVLDAYDEMLKSGDRMQIRIVRQELLRRMGQALDNLDINLEQVEYAIDELASELAHVGRKIDEQIKKAKEKRNRSAPLLDLSAKEVKRA